MEIVLPLRLDQLRKLECLHRAQTIPRNSIINNIIPTLLSQSVSLLVHRLQLQHSLPLKLLLAREMTDHLLGSSAATSLMMNIRSRTSITQTARAEIGWKITVTAEHRRQTENHLPGRGQGLHEGEHSLLPMAGRRPLWSDTVEALPQLDARNTEEPTKPTILLKRLIIRPRCLRCISRQ